MYILDLSKAKDHNQSGGKAANLARLVEMGFPVPDGFVITRDAFSCFLEQNHWVEKVHSLLEKYSRLEWPAQTQRYEQICAEIELAHIPRKVLEAVNPAVIQRLMNAPAGLAVRSSSICEDSQNASFAGIFESNLGVMDLESFWRAVLRCWCSAWSPKAAAYASKMGLELSIDGMAVLVQEMIPAAAAGVIFTADPVSGNPWRFVLNATFGLALQVVDEAAPADYFVLDWDTGEVLERHVVSKPEVIHYSQGKPVITSLLENQQHQPALDDRQLKQLGKLALEIDRAFGWRMDIEWALAEGQINILQARPLTSLPPFFPHTLSPDEAEQTWLLRMPLKPIAQDRLPLEMWDRHLRQDDIFPRRKAKERVIHGYYYSTEWEWSGNPSGYTRQGIELWLDANEERLRRDWLAQLETAHAANAWLDDVMEKTTRAVDWVRIALEYERLENEMHAAVWYAVQWMIFTCDDLMKSFITDIMPGSGINDLPGGLLQGLSCYSVERTADAQELGRGITEEEVQEAFETQPLQQVISFLRTAKPGCRFLKDFDLFCRKYGLEIQKSGEKDQDALDAEGLLLVLKASRQGQGEMGRDVKEVLASSAHRRLALEGQVRTYLQDHRSDQLDRFIKLLDWAQFWTPGLDNRKWHCAMVVRLKELFYRTGEALVAEGLIDHPQDFRLLTLGKWAAFVEHPDPAELVKQVRISKRTYERDRRLEPLPYLGKPPTVQSSLKGSAGPPTGEDHQAESHPAAAARKVFQGEGRAPGKARGMAYKITDMEKAGYVDGLTREHILICGPDRFNAQWRRDWYSLFIVVRGLVTVRSAQLHHATQIARECGVPFINLTDEDLDSLPDRAEVEINGQAGTLRVIKFSD